jgi:fatty-acyl-CoA synthase
VDERLTKYACGTLLELFERTASGSDRTITVLGRDGVDEKHAVGDLWEEAGLIATGLLDRGYGPGDRASVAESAATPFIVACLGAWRAGMALVPLPTRGPKRDAATWRRLATDRLAQSEVKVALGAGGSDLGVPHAPLAELRQSTPSTAQVSPEDLALLFFSSGTTSHPKGSTFSQRSLVDRLRLPALATRVPDEELHSLRWYNFDTAAGVTGLVLEPFGQGISAAILPNRYFGGARWLTEIDRLGISATGGAGFAYDLATRALLRGLDPAPDLSGWRVATALAEVVSPVSLQRFTEVSEPYGFRPESFSTAYVSSEAGFVTDGREGKGLRIAALDRTAMADGSVKEASDGAPSSSFLSNGAVLPEMSVVIADLEGSQLPERRIGEVWVKGPTVTRAYIGDPALNAAAFTDGWYRSGDAGFMDGDELFVIGRVNDKIIIRGSNYYPEDIEGVVDGSVADSKCWVFGVRDETLEKLVMVLETSDVTKRPDAGGARSAVWREFGLSVKDVLVVSKEEIPRTASGKVQRGVLKRLYEEGSLKTLD